MLRSFYKLYLVMIFGLIVLAVLVVPGLQHLFIVRTSTSSAEQVNSSLYLIRDRLMQYPPPQWTAVAAEIEAPFPLIAIDLTQRSSYRFTAAQAKVLDQGSAVRLEGGQTFATLGHSDRLVRVTEARIGPSSLAAFQALAWLTCGAVILIALFLWLRPHWRDLEKLRNAAERLGHGKLQSRASLSSHSSVAPLAERFDDMASRIETLVTTQSDMINAISHELRTPITRFGFGVALLQAAKSEEERQRHAQALVHDVAELEELVSELLSYGALKQVTRTPERQSIRLDELIGGVLGDLALEIEALGVQCRVNIEPSAEQALLNPRLTARVLLNLVKNATRYCRQRVAIHAAIQHDRLVIRVDDDGIGIPSTERMTIFEPFHRLDRSRDRNTGGFGLGLAIAKQAATAQGGELQALASPLGGARFELLLPLTADTLANVTPVRRRGPTWLRPS